MSKARDSPTRVFERIERRSRREFSSRVTCREHMPIDPSDEYGITRLYALLIANIVLIGNSIN